MSAYTQTALAHSEGDLDGEEREQEARSGIGGAPGKWTDKDLVWHLTRGREWALEMLMDRYGRQLHADARRNGGDWHEAEDVVQEAFVCLWRKRLELATVRNLKGYLRKVIKNRRLNRARKGKRVELHEPNWFATVPFELCESGANGEMHPWALVEALLPVEQWNMVNLRWKETCNLPLIAVRTGLPVWIVKRLLVAAMSTLKTSEECCSIRSV